MASVDDLEDVAIRVAEEEPGKGRVAQRLDHGGPVCTQSLFKSGKIPAGQGDRDMPAEFLLESRRLEVGIFDQVQFGPCAISSQAAVAGYSGPPVGGQPSTS